MAKKLVTVCWNITVAVDVPKGISNEDLVNADFRSSPDIQAVAYAAVKEANFNINLKDGQITDVQDTGDCTTPIEVSFPFGATVNATPKDGDFENPFTGKVVGYRNGLIQVQDMDDDVFECEAEQLSLAWGQNLLSVRGFPPHRNLHGAKHLSSGTARTLSFPVTKWGAY